MTHDMGRHYLWRLAFTSAPFWTAGLSTHKENGVREMDLAHRALEIARDDPVTIANAAYALEVNSVRISAP